MTTPAIKIDNVSKIIGGKSIVRDISFSVEKGHVVGFIGRNGAGKTTTLRMLLGATRVNRGKITVNGHKAGSPAAIRSIASLAERPSFYSAFSGMRNVRILLAAAGKKYYHNTIAKNFDKMDLLLKAKSPVSSYSKGMLTRLGIVHALSRNNDIYVFDEPGSGLDPLGIRTVRELMRDLADNGAAVLFSSHLLSEVERICDRMVIIDHGEIIKQGKLEDLYVEEKNAYTVKVALEEQEKALTVLGERATADRDKGTITVFDIAGAELSKLLFQNDIFPDALVPLRADLDTIFKQLIRTG